MFFCGLDLGQAADYTALSILEREPMAHRREPSRYSVRHLVRFELGTSYAAIAQSVHDTLTRPPLDRAWVALAVDGTGVGAAVVDVMRADFPTMASIIITGGRDVTPHPGGYNVPKLALVSTLQVLLQNRRLKVARTLPAAEVLAAELSAFRVKVNVATGNESFEAWRERDHDDLVLSVALAAWLGERHLAEQDDDDEPRMDIYYTR